MDDWGSTAGRSMKFSCTTTPQHEDVSLDGADSSN
jgi:hypothetical protein